jgi:hypothetical protein
MLNLCEVAGHNRGTTHTRPRSISHMLPCTRRSGSIEQRWSQTGRSIGNVLQSPVQQSWSEWIERLIERNARLQHMVPFGSTSRPRWYARS